MIIDCHAHIGKGELLNDVFQINSTPERLLYLMGKADVDKTVIFPVYYKNYRTPNTEIAEITAKDKRFIGFGRMNVNMPDIRAQVDYAVKELGLCGIKLHTMDGFPTRELMDRIAEHKIPVLAHSGMGTSPLIYEGLIQSYPDVTVILAHLGFDLNWSTMFSMPQSAFYLARKYKNVYLDTAAATWVQHILEQAVAEAGADKILFGSDAPWFYPSIMRACISDLEISERERQKILGGNIARILNL